MACGGEWHLKMEIGFFEFQRQERRRRIGDEFALDIRTYK